MYRGRVDSRSLTPPWPKQPVIPFSVDLRDIAPIRPVRSYMLCLIGNGLSHSIFCSPRMLHLAVGRDFGCWFGTVLGWGKPEPLSFTRSPGLSWIPRVYSNF